MNALQKQMASDYFGHPISIQPVEPTARSLASRLSYSFEGPTDRPIDQTSAHAFVADTKVEKNRLFTNSNKSLTLKTCKGSHKQ